MVFSKHTPLSLLLSLRRGVLSSVSLRRGALRLVSLRRGALHSASLLLLVLLAFCLRSCSISYKFNGASIDYAKVHSIAIADFPNNAALVYPALSADLSQGIRDLFQRQTRLQVGRKSGDLELEGEITGYAITPMAIAADSYSAETKLTVTIKVRFTNNVNPEESFEKTYSAYQTFDSSRMLSDVQEELCATMILELAENIYNDTVARW